MSRNKLFDIPPVSYFQTKNYFNGSCDDLNYDIRPDKDVTTLTVKIWHGKLCMPLSEIEQTKEFPVTQEGVDSVIDWLDSVYNS